MKTKKFFSDKQYGFRSNRNTTEAINSIIKFVKNSKNNKLHTAIVSLDIKGAFDHAWWPLILYRLKQANCPKNVYKLIQNYLNNRYARVETNSSQISIKIDRGCPQGSSSGLILWNILFNDLLKLNEKYDNNAMLQAFADDTILLVSDKNRENLCHTTNKLIEQICVWCTENKLKINPNKSSFIVVGKNTPLKRKISLNIDQNKISQSSKLKYLGLIIDDKISWTEHIQYIYNKVIISVNLINSIIGKDWGFKSETIKILYNCLLELQFFMLQKSGDQLF